MKNLILIFILLGVVRASATEVFNMHTNARAKGLGGAYSALVEDSESLFYNPAGIAKNGGIYWTIMDPKVGVSDIADTMDDLDALEDSSTFAAALDNLYGKPIWLGGSAKTALMFPYFAVAYFYDLDASFLVDNPVTPTLTTNYILDEGIALGSAFTIGGIFQMGFTARYVTRSGVRKTWGAQTIADIVSGTSTPDVIFDTFQTTTGVGFAGDLGININIPTMVYPTVSLVWKNIGNTKFRTDLGVEAPPSEEQDISVGASFVLDLGLIHFAPIIEIKKLNDSDIQMGKKAHLGLEVGIPFVDLRVGLNQGYLAYGAGVDLGLFKIDAAKWTEELGEYPGQFPHERYMVQATVTLGFDFGFGSGGSSAREAAEEAAAAGASGKHGKGASANRSKASRWKWLKQRR